MELNVRTQTGKTMTIEMEPNSTLIDLKEKILDKEGLPMYLQFIMFAGRQLHPMKNLAEQGVQSGSNLQLVHRLRSDDPVPIRLQKEDGSINNEYMVKLSSLLTEFKKMIAEKEGVAADSISFKLQDREILNESFVGDYYPNTVGHLSIYYVAAEKPEPEYGYDKLLTDQAVDKDPKDYSLHPHTTIETNKYYIQINHLIGHKRFIRSLSLQTAPETAFLVVSAVADEFAESRKEIADQLNVISYFGVRNVIVLVTKMDLIHYTPESIPFTEIESIITKEIISHKMRFKFVKCVPVSGTTGLNLGGSKTEKSSWYTGPTFIDLLDTIPPSIPAKKMPFRFAIEEVVKIAGIGYICTGKFPTGILSSGDSIIIAPEQWSTEVKAIENHHDEMTVEAGTSIGILTKHFAKDLRKGQVMGHPNNNPPQPVKDFTALLYVNKLPDLFKVDLIQDVKIHEAQIKCKIIEMIAKVDQMTGAASTLKDQKIEKNEYIVVKFEAMEPVSLELFAEFQELGKVTIQDAEGLIASGIVIDLTNDVKNVQQPPPNPSGVTLVKF